MTRTRPWRRMILHFSHIGFTDGRTFMVPFEEFGPVPRLWPPLRLPLPRHGARACGEAAPRGEITIANEVPRLMLARKRSQTCRSAGSCGVGWVSIPYSEEAHVARYMMLLFIPQGRTQEEAAAESPKWAAYTQELHDAGAFVNGDALQGNETATQLQVR